MKLLVLGATGSTGQQIVSQAIERGHSVTALFAPRMRSAGLVTASSSFEEIY
jgi:putative NADH-flavin reductase